VYNHAQHMTRRECLIKAFQFAALAAPCYAVTWLLDGDEPMVDQFGNGAGLADVVGVVAAVGASVFGLMTIVALIAAVLGGKGEIVGD
jgi:hypothetical protein